MRNVTWYFKQKWWTIKKWRPIQLTIPTRYPLFKVVIVQNQNLFTTLKRSYYSIIYSLSMVFPLCLVYVGYNLIFLLISSGKCRAEGTVCDLHVCGYMSYGNRGFEYILSIFNSYIYIYIYNFLLLKTESILFSISRLYLPVQNFWQLSKNFTQRCWLI